MMSSRCPWSESSDLMRAYHDEEWGTPVHDERLHFEFLLLETMQAGLSWTIILNKRENFSKAFDNFDPKKVSRYDEGKITSLLTDAGIIRNQLKIRAAVNNAQRFLETAAEFGSFDAYIWHFSNGGVIQNRLESMKQMPVTSDLSDLISSDLKKRGFKFVGSTTIYSHLQAIGVINDHLTSCPRYEELSAGA